MQTLRTNAPALREQQASAVESIRAEGIDARLISTEGVAMCGDGVHYSDRGCYEVSLRLERAILNRQEPATFDVASWSDRMERAKAQVSRLLPRSTRRHRVRRRLTFVLAAQLEAEMEKEMSFGSLLGGEKKRKMVNYTYGEVRACETYFTLLPRC